MRSEKAKIWLSAIDGCQLISATYQKQEFARHYHEHYVIGLNTSGCHQSYYRGGNIILPTHCVVVIDPGEIHTGKSASESLWIYRAMYPTYSQVVNILDIPNTKTISFRDPIIYDNELANIFFYLHRLLEENEPSLEVDYWLHLFYRLLIKRYSDFSLKDDPASMPHSIKKAKEYLSEHYHKAVLLNELAKVANLNKFRLIKSFKTHTGLTPHAFQNQLKIDRAKQLLRKENDIAMVAYDLGFTDQAHFTRWFKKILGVTPGQYI